MDPDAYAALRAEVEREVRRVAERLHSLSPARLAESVGAHPSRAAAGRAAAQALADAAADLEGVSRRAVPELSDLAVGDQVAVTGTDLLLAAGAAPAAACAGQVVGAALAALREVRRAL